MAETTCDKLTTIPIAHPRATQVEYVEKVRGKLSMERWEGWGGRYFLDLVLFLIILLSY